MREHHRNDHTPGNGATPAVVSTSEMIIVVVIAFLNEEEYLGTCLSTFAEQRRPPDRLILVDDGSTDGSYEIASAFAADHDHATVLRRPPRATASDRLATAGELRAFQWGIEQLEGQWDILAKVDADLFLPPDLLSTIEHEFRADPKLGMAGPYLSTLGPDGEPVRQRCPPNHVEGPAKFYRRECFEQISPLPQILGWDTLDESRARMLGWRTASFGLAGGDVIHLRPMGSHDGLLRAHWRWGLCAYGYGEHPVHVILVGLQKARDRPRLIGGLSYVAGFASASARRLPRAEPELRAFVHRDQLHRIRRRLQRSLASVAGRPVLDRPARRHHVCAVAYTGYASDPRVRREAEALARAGADVTVLVLRQAGEPAREEIRGVHVIHLPVVRQRGETARSYLGSYLHFFLRSTQYLSVRARRFDVVHVHSVPEAMVFAAAATRLAGRPVLLDVHDLSSDLYANRFGASPWMVRTAERISLRFANEIVTVHDHYRNLIVDRGVPASKITVVLNTPDEELFGPPREPVWSSGGLRLVYHGTFLERYGLGTLVDAFAVIRQRIPGSSLELYGDGDFRDEIQRLISLHVLGSAVRLSAGAVPVEEIPASIAGAHIGIVPFLEGPFTASILPTKLLEYILMGIPAIVARNQVVEAYFGGDMVTFVRPGNAADVIAAVEGLAREPERALQMARQAQIRLREHSWETEQDRFLALVEGMASR